MQENYDEPCVQGTNVILKLFGKHFTKSKKAKLATILALGKQRQKDHTFKASLGYILTTTPAIVKHQKANINSRKKCVSTNTGQFWE